MEPASQEADLWPVLIEQQFGHKTFPYLEGEQGLISLVNGNTVFGFTSDRMELLLGIETYGTRTNIFFISSTVVETDAVAALARLRDSQVDGYTEMIKSVIAEQARIRIEADYAPPTARIFWVFGFVLALLRNRCFSLGNPGTEVPAAFEIVEARLSLISRYFGCKRSTAPVRAE